MPSIVIENFKYGLDKRRSMLTSVMGTLDKCENAHINQGGEIEKRKAFIRDSLVDGLPAGAHSKPPGVTILGVEALKDVIVIYGAGENVVQGLPDDPQWPRTLTPNGIDGKPFPQYPLFVYQRLWRYPAQDANEATGVCQFDPISNQPLLPGYCEKCMDYSGPVEAKEIISSTTYSNKTFVIARMTDDTIMGFYDGVIIPDINYAGVQLPDMTTELQFWCQVVKSFSKEDEYSADINNDNIGITITGKPGNKYSVVTETIGMCSGTFVTRKTSEGVTPVPGKVATGFFSIEDGYSHVGSVIQKVEVGPGDNMVDLIGEPVSFLDDPVTTARKVAERINRPNPSPGHKYSAVNDGATVILYSNEMTETDNKAAIWVTANATVVIGKCAIGFTGTGFSLDYIKVDDQDILGSLNRAFPSFVGETLTGYVKRISEHIQTTNPNFSAIARENILKISHRVTKSDIAAVAEVDDNPTAQGLLPVVVKVTAAPGKTGGVYSGDPSFLSARTDLTIVPILFQWKKVFGFNSSLSKSYSSFGRSTAPLRAIVTGGTPPYKLNWRTEDVNNVIINIVTPNSLSTYIEDAAGNEVKDGKISSKRATLYLDVTDSKDQKTTSAAISFTFNLTEISSGDDFFDN